MPTRPPRHPPMNVHEDIMDSTLRGLNTETYDSPIENRTSLLNRLSSSAFFASSARMRTPQQSHQDRESLLGESSTELGTEANGPNDSERFLIPPSNHLPSSVQKNVLWHTLCIMLHVLFAVLHLVMLTIMVRRIERRVHIRLEDTSFWTTVIQIALQVFATLYLAACLFVTQKIFLYRILISFQTLTKSHDQLSAWLGLGGAALSLTKQRRARSGPLSIFLIATYLACLAGLKITTSALIQLSTTAVPEFQRVMGTSMLPEGLRDAYSGRDLAVAFRAAYSGLRRVGETAESLGYSANSSSVLAAVLPFIGLEGNTLYDVVPVVPNATRAVEVNSYSVHANCHSFDPRNATWNWKADLKSDYAHDNWEFPKAGPKANGTFELWKPLKHTLKWPFLTFLNITDSAGTTVPQISVQNLTFLKPPDVDPRADPTMWMDDGDKKINTIGSISVLPFSLSGDSDNSTFPCLLNGDPLDSVFGTPTTGRWRSNLTTFSVGVCDINVEESRRHVYGNARNLVNSVGPMHRKNGSSWTPVDLAMDESSGWTGWYEPYYLFDQGVDTMKYYRAHPMEPDDPISTFSGFTCSPANNSDFIPYASRPPSLMQIHLFRDLGIFQPSSSNATSTPPIYHEWPSIRLHDMEDALENFIATSLFTGLHASRFNGDGPQDLASFQVAMDVPVDALMSELRLSPIPVYAGFIISLLMFGIAAWIVSTTPVPTKQSALDSLGLLQLVWLSGGHWGDTITKPTENKLRQAGLTKAVRLKDGAESGDRVELSRRLGYRVDQFD
ncbi:hypothetical protein DL96DRAFT_1556016 [Flagelloscypha sp. PMI_526]|nr:hypothetical protein DL96DRAFT_1556016 [Flagelloscypha sp. PMI_526]